MLIMLLIMTVYVHVKYLVIAGECVSKASLSAFIIILKFVETEETQVDFFNFSDVMLQRVDPDE